MAHETDWPVSSGAVPSWVAGHYRTGWETPPEHVLPDFPVANISKYVFSYWQFCV